MNTKITGARLCINHDSRTACSAIRLNSSQVLVVLARQAGRQDNTLAPPSCHPSLVSAAKILELELVVKWQLGPIRIPCPTDRPTATMGSHGKTKTTRRKSVGCGGRSGSVPTPRVPCRRRTANPSPAEAAAAAEDLQRRLRALQERSIPNYKRNKVRWTKRACWKGWEDSKPIAFASLIRN